ncbi:TraR/DksA family transcriptional regulator [Gracilimonas mengyeensis]|uniref:Transcriptional regulator, TraR/DksA family n=1 Tax=Gracilimonas mengyeensis TaxID=1302730 RepID=A0A521CVR8_9BACT|nr:TraR/DksA C4-type zinc finger protein [Gracilimonas mengyeensis]SMO63549.1 transcriptional regulator, TraR/DksA family [Gracilimonas mengyeensis]
MSKQETPVNNTPFSEEELDHFKELLNEEKEEAQNKIETFQERVEELEEKLNDTTSSAAHHQGNIASSEEEREKYYTMIEREKEKIEDIKVALDKIEAGNYGICNVTGKPIAKERLEVVPHAKYSKEAKESQTGTVQRDRMQVH